MHASEFLKSASDANVAPFVVLHGNQRFLVLESLRRITRSVLGEEDEFGPSRFDDPRGELPFRDVSAELSTRSMFGENRLVIIDGADRFVSNHRAALEKYLQSPSTVAVLVLVVEKWPGNTRLAKMAAKSESALVIECAPLKGAELRKWIARRLKADGKTIDGQANDLLVELAGHDLGLLDRDLAKLVDYLGERSEITHEDVVQLVGGWKADTTFRMLRFLRENDIADALRELEYLMRAGESPHRILGGMQFSFRRITKAAEAMRLGASAREAVAGAGVFPQERAETAAYLEALGPRRRARLYDHFLRAQLALRGVAALDSKTHRIEIERLLVQLSAAAK